MKIYDKYNEELIKWDGPPQLKNIKSELVTI